MPHHLPRAYILAMPPGTECERRGLDTAFGAEEAEAFWAAWHRDLLPPLFRETEIDARLAYGPRTEMAYYRSLVARPGQLCFIPAKNLATRWARMLEIGLAATRKVIVAASDVARLSPGLLHEVFAKLDQVDVVLGREREDRFWLVGQRRWDPRLWEYDFEGNAPLPGFAELADTLGISVDIAFQDDDLNDADAVRRIIPRLSSDRFPHSRSALKALGVSA